MLPDSPDRAPLDAQAAQPGVAYRCGRRRRHIDRPCRTPVAVEGAACVWHTAPWPEVDEWPDRRVSIDGDADRPGAIILTIYDVDARYQPASVRLWPASSRRLAEALTEAAEAELAEHVAAGGVA